MTSVMLCLTKASGRIILCAAFLLIALPLSTFANPPEFAHIRIVPMVFSPNSDGVQDSITIFYTLTDTAETVFIQVLNAQGRIVRTLVDSVAQSAGEHYVSWDGKDHENLPVPDGKYAIIFGAGNSAGAARQASIKVAVDTVAPSLSVEDIIPSPYTPDISGSDSTVTISFYVSQSDSSDNVFVVIVDTDAITALDILRPESFVGDGEYRVSWDGRSKKDGLYPFWLKAIDRAGNSSEVTSFSVDLDISGPIILFTSPENTNDTLEVVEGTVFDRNGVKDVEVSLDRGQSFSPLYISGLGTLSWSVDLPDSLRREGKVIIQVKATDLSGHISLRSDTLNADFTPPERPAFDELPERVASPELTISGKTSPGDSIFISITDSAGAIIADTTAVANTDSVFSVQMTLTLGGNSIHAFARDVAGNSSDSSSVLVFYEEAIEEELIEPRISFPEKFPDKFDENVFKIDLPKTEKGIGVEIHIYNLVGDLVRTLVSSEKTFSHKIPWDTRNDRGELLRNGVYLCNFVIRLSNGTTISEKKLVAIVR